MKRLLLLITICISSVSFGQVPSYVPTNGLVGWWGFNGNANDESGNGYNGIISNGASYTADRNGISNSAMLFPGLLNLPVATYFSNNEWTFSFWTRKDANLGHNPIQIFEMNGSQGASFGFTSLNGILNGNNEPRIYAGNGGTSCGQLATVSDCIVSTGDWTHITYTYSIDFISIYKNGALCSSVSMSTGDWSCINSNMALWIGGDVGGGVIEYFTGAIDDIGIWNRALSPCEVQALYSGQITSPSSGTDVISACASYQWIDGNTYTQSTNTPTFVLTNTQGCDSTVTLDLTITQPNTGSETVTECDSYTWSTNGQTYTQSGQYTSVLTNQSGCDSTVTLNLTITQPNTGSENVTECDSYTWSTNGQTYTQSGQYTSVLTNQSGCDSTVTLNLTITNSNTSSETVTECNSYTWNTNGQTYTQSGQYTEVLTNQSGCDSTVTLNLTIETVDITTQPVDQTVVVGNNVQFTVTTSATNPTYQWQMNDGTGWIDLFNAGQYSGVDADILNIANVQLNQNNYLYRCAITNGNCSSVSEQVALNIEDNTGLYDLNTDIFNVYPNPTSNSFTISSEKVINSEFTIIDSQGREVLTGSMNGQEHTIDISKLSKGVYSVVFNNTEYPVVSVIKE